MAVRRKRTAAVMPLVKPEPRSLAMRVCDQVELEVAANTITRSMLRTFAGLAFAGEALPTVFVASADVAAELVRRWNAQEC